MFTAFVDGPFWYFSLVVFVLGMLLRLFGILSMPSPESLSKPKASSTAGAVRANIRRFFPHRQFLPNVSLPVVAGYMFHVGLLLLLFFAQPHVEFYAKYVTGFAWPALPRWAFIVTAEIAFSGLILLWLFRLLHPVTRTISNAGDHAGSILIFVVMLTGCLALLESFNSLRVIHFFFAELLLIYFPFSPLFHAVTFPISRSYNGATYGRRGVNV